MTSGRKIKTWTYDNGEYTGEVEHGKRHGQGTYKWTTGEKFNGAWFTGLREGKGFLKYAKGTKHEGFWKDDEPWGRGIVTWDHGIRFKGIFQGWAYAKGELTVIKDNTVLWAELIDDKWELKIPNSILKRSEYTLWHIPANIHERALWREREAKKSW